MNKRKRDLKVCPGCRKLFKPKKGRREVCSLHRETKRYPPLFNPPYY